MESYYKIFQLTTNFAFEILKESYCKMFALFLTVYVFINSLIVFFL